MKELESQLKQYVLIRKEYEETYKEICNPNLHHIAWCIKLGKKDCPKTCYYAIEKLKERNEK